MASNPPLCLAAYPNDVQKCSDPYPDRANPGEQTAEREAAAATGAAFIPTSQWLCASRCSPIVGDFITHVDQGHITEMYAAFLSVVMSNRLRSLLSSK
jgi:predicted nucleic acid-binding Zn ribbon protein